MWGDEIIVSQNIRIVCTHENTTVLFSDLFTLGPGLKNVRFQAPKTSNPSEQNGNTIKIFYVYN